MSSRPTHPQPQQQPSLCRDCLHQFDHAPRCPNCGRPRVLSHPELYDLSIAHMDCDAFFASVEKRDNPELADKPVIIGGGRRGVVSTACYIARIKGVRSAMPMYKALQLCPEAVVIPGRMSAYAEASREIRQMMDELTPVVEPLSLDEAFIDLTGTEKLHGAPPAVVLARLAKRMKDELGLTGSIGLSHNKFLAKIASDLDKPRGFSIIGKAETMEFLADKPVGLIWGVGKVGQASLEKAGIRSFTDLRRWSREDLQHRFGSMGERLWHLAEQCSNRSKAKGEAGHVVTPKLKRADHSSLTRRRTLPQPTNMADVIYRTARDLLEQAIDEGPFRLIGVGIAKLTQEFDDAAVGDLLDPDAQKRADVERASDEIKRKFGKGVLIKGRSLN